MKQECKTSKSAELFIVSCEIITWTCDKGKALYEEGVIEKKFEEEIKKKTWSSRRDFYLPPSNSMFHDLCLSYSYVCRINVDIR